MTLLQDTQQAGLAGVRVVDTLNGLSAIADDDCAAAIWQRPVDPAFGAWVGALAPAQLPNARVILRPDHVRDAVEQICDAAATPEAAERAWLVADVNAMAGAFAAMMQAPYLRLRLDVVTTNACRKFHIDAVTARLVCTYRGTGTQYGLSVNKAEPVQIETVPTGAPIVLRGTRWPATPNAGLRHRSPPIEGTGETRLMLVLDPIFDLEEEV